MLKHSPEMRDQARTAGRRDQGDRAQTSNCEAGGGNGRKPLHSTTNVLHSNNSLFIGYDNSHSPGMLQRPGLTFREMSSNVTLIFSLKMQNTGHF